MSVEGWFERLQAEKDELAERITKLEAFLHTDQFRSLCLADRDLLNNQKVYMEMYLECLHQRIGRHIVNSRSKPT